MGTTLYSVELIDRKRFANSNFQKFPYFYGCIEGRVELHAVLRDSSSSKICAAPGPFTLLRAAMRAWVLISGLLPRAARAIYEDQVNIRDFLFTF
jgi:hypothetical protein